MLAMFQRSVDFSLHLGHTLPGIPSENLGCLPASQMADSEIKFIPHHVESLENVICIFASLSM